MGENVEMTNEQATLYSNKLFFNAVLPVLKTIVENTPKLAKKWEGKSAVHQVACMHNGEKEAMHFVVEEGAWTVVRGVFDGKPTSELLFKSREHMNGFFKGKILPLPKGMLSHFGFLSALLTMSGLLGAKQPPKDVETQALLTRCMFYLLSSGISTLNKLGHPAIKAWTQKSPDRVYAWAVDGYPDLSAYIRIKAGNSRAARGVYKRSMPFFTMKFDSPRSALGILLEVDDMIKSTVEGKLTMVGGPEFGAQLGDHMLLVGSMIK
ncbi:MAG: hypothetical protein JXR63_11040 [Spirochaetales bacterium]|nr:hypothetical protein [Spirochaetales bacterium]